MKIYVLAPKEDWICDRFVKEWSQDNTDITTDNIHDADIIWLLADWCWNQISPHILRSKIVVATVHHLVPSKMTHRARKEFAERDEYIDLYHVPNVHTRLQILELTEKSKCTIPFWANQKIWKRTNDKKTLRKKYGIDEDAYIVGSFQRDTEGSDLVTPKYEKGPDLLADYLEKIKSDNLHVLLSGWRRQYIIKRIEDAGINYTYIQLPPQHVINELYQTLDLYPVTARYEGGPQSLVECGMLNVPVVSRDVGIASVVLPKEAINDDVSLATPAVPNVAELLLPLGYDKFREMFYNLYSSTTRYEKILSSKRRRSLRRIWHRESSRRLSVRYKVVCVDMAYREVIHMFLPRHRNA